MVRHEKRWATYQALNGQRDEWSELPEMELEGKREPVLVFAPSDE